MKTDIQAYLIEVWDRMAETLSKGQQQSSIYMSMTELKTWTGHDSEEFSN